MKQRSLYAAVALLGIVILFEAELLSQPALPEPVEVVTFCHPGTHPDTAAVRRIGASVVDVLGDKVAARQFDELAGPSLSEEGGVIAHWPPQAFALPTVLGPKRRALGIESLALAIPDDTRRG
ncbi:MAG TPA: hypothetical protein VGN14_03380, partial [Candidatus Elarobacter sp.]